jgi:two-component system sensor histidine kinase KdpD
VLVGLADSMFLTQPPPTAAQAEIAQSLREEALRVSSQVSNLLDMARLQAGRVELNRQWQPLDEVIGSALKSVERLLTKHPVKISLDEDLPLVEIDFPLMERVFCNLLENAVKYTPDGSVIEIGAKAMEKTVEVRVDDNGPGVPAGKEDVIFKKFERGQPESTTRGVGLGLAICRAIVQAHGGDIHVENRPEGGAHFFFSLPRGNPPELEAEEVVEVIESGESD